MRMGDLQAARLDSRGRSGVRRRGRRGVIPGFAVSGLTRSPLSYRKCVSKRLSGLSWDEPALVGDQASEPAPAHDDAEAVAALGVDPLDRTDLGREARGDREAAEAPAPGDPDLPIGLRRQGDVAAQAP